MDNKYAHVMHLGNPTNTIAVLNRYGFNFQKKFGQNFLIDAHVINKIISAADITKDDCVLEIGPGIGTMTQYLAEAAREVAAPGPAGRGDRRWWRGSARPHRRW